MEEEKTEEENRKQIEEKYVTGLDVIVSRVHQHRSAEILFAEILLRLLHCSSTKPRRKTTSN